MSGPRVLVVDDNVTNLRLIEYLLQSKGYEVHTASDAESALELVHSLKPGLVLMDLQLPGMDGLTLTRKLKADPRTQSFEVLVKAPPVPGLLAAGNTVMVRLPLGDPQRRLSVPRDALIIRAEGLYVFRIGTGDRAERVSVKAGVADGDWVAVDGTLKAGDRIVVRGGESLRGQEKLDVVGVFEEEAKRAEADVRKSGA